MLRQLHIITTAGIALAASGSAGAATLLIDFGTGPVYTGTNDPAHLDGTVPISFTDWQGVSNLNSQTVADSAGNSIFVDLGRNGSDAVTNALDFDRPVTAVSGTGTGVFSTDLTQDGIISFGTTTPRDPVAALIAGLPTGDYYVYVIAHYAGNTSTSFNVRAGSTNVSPDGQQGFNEITNIYAALPFGDTLEGGNTSSWALGVNYARFTVSLTAESPKLLVASDRSEATQNNSTLAAVIITSVPEPASLALLTPIGLAVLRSRSR